MDVLKGMNKRNKESRESLLDSILTLFQMMSFRHASIDFFVHESLLSVLNNTIGPLYEGETDLIAQGIQRKVTRLTALLLQKGSAAAIEDIQQGTLRFSSSSSSVSIQLRSID